MGFFIEHLSSGGAEVSKTDLERALAYYSERKIRIAIVAQHLRFLTLAIRDAQGYDSSSNEKLHRLTYDALTVVAGRKLFELDSESFRDSLTALFNKKAFARDCEKLSVSGESFRPTSIVYIDLDGLKLINDSDGHEAGDRALLEFGRWLQDSVSGFRPNGGTAYRFSGDEFAALLPEASRDETSHYVAGIQGIRKFSFGVAALPEDGTDYAAVCKLADERMYAQKFERKQRSRTRLQRIVVCLANRVGLQLR